MEQTQQNRRAVLVVEDDPELRRFAARLLEDDELDTIACESAEAALATMLIRGRDIAMIFADIRLPGAMDGIDLAREVRMRWPFLPVILTSGHPPRAPPCWAAASAAPTPFGGWRSRRRTAEIVAAKKSCGQNGGGGFGRPLPVSSRRPVASVEGRPCVHGLGGEPPEPR